MFVLAELIWAIGTKPEEKSKPRPKDLTSHEKLKWSECKQCFPVILKSSLIGAIVGALPGVGSTVASFLAYYECKRRAKNKEIWGKGAIEGVAAAEAANNAVSGPSLGLLLTLGIPGGSIGIILGSVLIFYNIELGQVFPQSTNVLIYQLVFSGFIGITIYGLLGFFGAPHLYRFVKSIPKNILYPIVFLSTFVSAYLCRGEIFDVLIMLLVGFGTVMLGKHEFNRAAFIITFVLADGLESSFRAVIERDDLGLFLFLERPIAPILLAIASAGFLFAIRNLYKQYLITRHGTVRRTRTRL
jgi:putative tricarboxylic transport membrane protein